MTRLFRLLLIVVLSYLHPAALADNAIDCVDPDIARTLIGSPGEGGVQISRELPERFPPVAVPETFTLIGSRASPMFSLVAFKSSLSLADAKSNIESSMSGSAWQRLEFNQHRATGGFQAPPASGSPIRDAANFCHDDYGRITAMFSESASTTYVTLMATRQRSRQQCDNPQQRMFMSGVNVVEMPVLTLPEGINASQMGRISSSGDNASTSIQLDTERKPSELLQFFGAQLVAQDWLEEAEWIGEYVSGSAWLSKDRKSSGLLRVVDHGDQQYKLSFETIRHL